MDFNNTTPYDMLSEKWSAILDHSDLPRIDDVHRRRTTAVLLENQKRALREQAGYLTEAPTNAMNGGFAVSAAAAATNTSLQGYDPILISLVRRAMPNVVAYDVAGVQPMTAPTGLIFAMRARYDSQTGPEAMFDEPVAAFSGASGSTYFNGAVTAGYSGGYTYTNPYGANEGSVLPGATAWYNSANRTGQFNYFRGFLTGQAENLSSGPQSTSAGVATGFREMAFSIERVAVEARTRALKAEYTTELAQDLKAVHGLDAESELANILSVEILNEINREIIRAVYASAKAGAQQTDLSNIGSYDLVTDSDGRWSAERYRGLMYQIERESNVIAKETRRGKGNFIICSSDVASALAMGGFLNLSPALNTNLNVDDTGNVFAGVLNGKFKVFIDPFVPAGIDFITVGYKGTNPYDAGMFYCPYVPLQMVRAVGENTFQPKIGFKTRYGMVANPFAGGRTPSVGLGDGLNTYYRLFRVTSLHGNQA
jgi:hypothetical protein